MSNNVNGNPIQIKKSRKGLFTKKAKAHGESNTSYAHQVLLSGSGANKQLKEEAQFDLNAKKFKH